MDDKIAKVSSEMLLKWISPPQPKKLQKNPRSTHTDGVLPPSSAHFGAADVAFLGGCEIRDVLRC